MGSYVNKGRVVSVIRMAESTQAYTRARSSGTADAWIDEPEIGPPRVFQVECWQDTVLLKPSGQDENPFSMVFADFLHGLHRGDPLGIALFRDRGAIGSAHIWDFRET
ncbi:hypothetical protein CLCR_10955 [Cladophialophora carrionii]|uniref:Uncharacterized protein n=1 Tax=Cladophialophora carrionii TaxID=86049 RepID=A0A1C1CXK7_9EURO|nr:hypothetical protein CLCR_10955 [Cladophialophora carrionii]